MQFLRDQVAISTKNHQLTAKIHSSTIFDEKLHLDSEVIGSINMDEPWSGNHFAELIKSAKDFHARLRAVQLEDIEAIPVENEVESQSEEEKYTKGGRVRSTQTLKMLSLERKRILEEFNALLQR